MLSFAVARATNPPGAPADHFVAYKTKAEKVPPFSKITGLSLVDQFESGSFDVLAPADLLVPADKNGEGIVDAATHLRAYKIKASRGGPKHVKQLGVSVTNQFGTLSLDTMKPDLLLVPSAKDLSVLPAPPANESHEVDHYKCYAAKVTKGTPAPPAGLRARVADQFASPAKVFDVVKPKHLCLPVNKRGEGIKNPAGRLVCYQVKQTKGQCASGSPANALGGCKTEVDCGGVARTTTFCAKQPKHTARTQVGVSNQFGQLRLSTVKETELCVPSVATPPMTPTPVETSPPTPSPFDTPGPTDPPTPTPTPTPTPSPSPTPTPTPSPYVSPLPPDPEDVAPPNDPSVPTQIATSTEFLYSGDNPIQTGVAPGTIDPKRVVILRGKVYGPDRGPLPGVSITIKDHDEFGQTASRADGMFDLAANGGSWLTIEYRKAGFVPAQRQVKTEWAEFAWAEDVKLVAYDSVATQVDLTALQEIAVAQGSVVVDDDGSRQATLLIPPGTAAEMVMPDGSTHPMDSIVVRATEYTVGPDGPTAMPMPLPPSSGYTYAVEYSVDEAVTAGAVDVRFSQPLYHYVENFLGFPVGMNVPVGYYDRERALWVPSNDGKVIGILGVTGGLADVDVDGTGLPASSAALAALAMTDEERTRLATLYVAGTQLWRVAIEHFTPWDCNWPYVPPQDAEKPSPPSPPFSPDPIPLDDRDSTQCRGSVVDCENGTLGEGIAIVGTPYSLHYSSDRVPGRARSTLSLPLSGPSVPASLQTITLDIEVAGQKISQSFPAQPNLSTTFTWGGKDGYGREVYGRVEAKVKIGFVYDAVYAAPNAGGAAFQQSFARFSSVRLTGNRARNEITIPVETTMPLDRFEAPAIGLGGWTIDAHHFLDRGGSILYMGDGSRRTSSSVPLTTITTVAGTGNFGYSGDGGPATEAGLSEPKGIAVDAAGNLFIADSGNRRVRRVDATTGIITTAAGNGIVGYSGDGGPATSATLGNPSLISVDAAGNLFIADSGNHRVRRVDATTGIITTVAGNGILGYFGDGGLATAASVAGPQGVAVDAAGNLFIADSGNHRVRRVDATTGIITTVAGDGMGGYSGDGGPATAAKLRSPAGSAVDAAGNLFIAGGDRVRRVDATTGIITTVAGNGIEGYAGDGGPATSAKFDNPTGIVIDAAGNLFIADSSNGSVRRVDARTGIVTTVAGFDSQFYAGPLGDGGPATASPLGFPVGIAIDAANDLFIVGRDHKRVRRVGSVLSKSLVATVVPATDGTSEVYSFDFSDRHIETRHALTNSVLFKFGYDDFGRLAEIRDGIDLVTTIEHDSNGNPIAIVAPFGQRTTFTVDANGYLASVANPAGETARMTYSALGLLTSMEDARGNASTMTYDANGRLLSDVDASSGSQTLAAVISPSTLQVARTTGLGRTTSHLVENLTTGDRRQTDTATDGTQTVRLIRQDGTRVTATADGMVDTLVEGPDSRFSMLSPLEKSRTVKTPANLQRVTAQARQWTLSNLANPLSVVSGTETRTVNGRNYSTAYTAATKRSTSTSPAGRTATSTIDGLGRVVQSQITGLLPLSMSYDPATGNVASITHGAGADARITTFDYDSAGYMQSVTDPLNRTMAYEYDLAGRPTLQRLPDGRRIEYGYDANGNLTSLTPPGRPAHTFSYSPVNLVSEYVPPDVGAGTNRTLYDYNADRQPTLVTRPDGKTIGFEYDAAGRLSKKVIERGAVRYSYSSSTGQLTSITAPDGGVISYAYDGSLPTTTTWTGLIAGSVSRTYDNDFREASVSVNGANSIALQYDADSLLRRVGSLVITRDPQKGGLATGTTLGNVTDALTYNDFGDIASYTARFGGTDIYHYELVRDDLGRIKEKVETIDGVTTTYDYTYDTAGRLSQVQRYGAVVSSYTYDNNSNRLTGPSLSTMPTYDDQDRLLQYESELFTYTPNGELATRTKLGTTTTYSYDELGSLVEVDLSNGERIEYLIDGLDRRIGKARDGLLEWGLLYLDGLRPVAQLDGAGHVVSRFAYADRDNVPEYMLKAGATYRLVSDHLGSVRLVVNTATGVVAQRLDYDEFGRVLRDTAPGFQPFGFAGGIYDPATGLVRLGLRDFDPEVGRWTSKDPMRFGGGAANLYEYVGSDPVNHTDPTGQYSSPGAVIVAAELFDFVVGLYAAEKIPVNAGPLGVGAFLADTANVCKLAGERASRSLSGVFERRREDRRRRIADSKEQIRRAKEVRAWLIGAPPGVNVTAEQLHSLSDTIFAHETILKRLERSLK